ncbi:MAG TPA: cytochrome c biogenesis protein ResB [Candidatus Methylacidiphilales bacterium]|nr:cytochrome c biogenesis protein ResB [Candidatus Methylacidiphilales bacterium]
MAASAKASRLGRRLFRFLSSVRLAVILLMVLIVGIAVGTICESRFDAKVARAYVYEAPWFDAWMILLGVNLFCAAWSRYPWKRHHTGFVITHAGIITLLVGALVGRIWGIEGTMTLYEGHEPDNALVIDTQEVRVKEGGQMTTFPIGLAQERARDGRPVVLGTTPGGWKLTATDYAETLQPVSTAEAVTENGSPALQVKLWSMGQNIDEWLWPGDPDNSKIDLGLLAVECRLGQAPAPARQHASNASFQARHPELVEGSVQPPPGKAGGTDPSASPGTTNATGLIHLAAFTPTAALKNPAPELPPGDRAVIYLSEGGKLSYYLQTKHGDVSQGALEPGKPLATGWGNWQMEVEQIVPQAVPSTDFKPIPKTTRLPPRDRASLTSGLQVDFARGDDHDTEWLATGWEIELPGADGTTMHAEFGPKIYPLPVSLTLKNFEVERNEGLDTPAGFKSTIEVRDTAGNSAVGSCSMNVPMNFPDAWWRGWTGLTYKISQASWNPDNLKQSSVQILLDPGWLFKWTGSLMVSAGIFTMFYLRPPRTAAHP